MLLQPVIDRLRAQTTLRSVQGAVELAAALEASALATPAAYVVPMGDRPQADEGMTGGALQLVVSTLAIVLVVDNRRDATGAAAAADLEQLRVQVRRALLGWAPEGMDAPITAGRGQLIDLIDGRVWWGDEYHIEQYWSSDE